MPRGAEKIKLKRVDDDICDLSLSELTEVPVREISSYKRIVTLDLSSNRLVTLGRNFITLTHLVKIDLSKNQIRSLPEDFGQLEQLRHLDLYDNRLQHLPFSFERLRRLRYLDLKGNPLLPAWEKVVGRCSTLAECQQAAKNTVALCAKLKSEYTERERVALERQMNVQQMAGDGDASPNSTSSHVPQANGVAANKKASKSKKSKVKKNAASVDNELSIKPVPKAKANNQRTQQKRKAPINARSLWTTLRGGALLSLVAFLVLLLINMILIYMIMFKNPEIADKLVEYIPPQYRDWISTKTEIFRLHVTDWISEFRTPPEEH